MSDLLKALSAPFPANEVEWRVGSTSQDKKKGLALAYLTARHIMDRLDHTIGAANWQDRYEFHGGRTVCYLSLRIGDEWITKADGAGDSDVEAEKGAISDALKRAAVKWGIGRYLYELGNTWVELDEWKKIKPTEYHKLERALTDLMTGGVVPEKPTRLRTVEEEKKRYEELVVEMNAEVGNGAAAMARWINDPSVLADVNSLERYGEQFKREYKATYKIVLEAEKAKSKEASNAIPAVPPNFENLEP